MREYSHGKRLLAQSEQQRTFGGCRKQVFLIALDGKPRKPFRCFQPKGREFLSSSLLKALTTGRSEALGFRPFSMMIRSGRFTNFVTCAIKSGNVGLFSIIHVFHGFFVFHHPSSFQPSFLQPSFLFAISMVPFFIHHLLLLPFGVFTSFRSVSNSSSAFSSFSVILSPVFSCFKMSNFASGLIPFSQIVTSCSSNLEISLYCPNSGFDFLTFCSACPPMLKERREPFLIPLLISLAFSISSRSLITTKKPTSSTSVLKSLPCFISVRVHYFSDLNI